MRENAFGGNRPGQSEISLHWLWVALLSDSAIKDLGLGQAGDRLPPVRPQFGQTKVTIICEDQWL